MDTATPMSKRRIFLILAIFFSVLLIFRFGWLYIHQVPDHPKAENGVIDFSAWEFTDDQAITLDGEWEFYPDVFLEPDEINENVNQQYITVPNDWREDLPNTDKLPPYGFGTYRIKLLLPENKTAMPIYGFKAKEIATAARAYVDGNVVKIAGNPATNDTDSESYLKPFSFYFHPDSSEAELVLHVSNFKSPLSGGITKSIQFGTESAINQVSNISIVLQIIVSSIYLLHGIYAISIYFIGKIKGQNVFLFFGIMLFAHGFLIAFDDDRALYLASDFTIHYRLLLFLSITTLASIILFMKYLIQQKSRFFTIMLVLYSLLILGIIFIPDAYLNYLLFMLFAFHAIAIPYLFYITIKVVRKSAEALFILLFFASYMSNMFWGLLINVGIVDIPFYPFDFLITIMMMALLLIQRHLRVAEVNRKQTIELQEIDKKKDKFLINTSHELRSPLYAVINIAESMLNNRNNNLSEDNKKNLQMLVDIGGRMRFTLNDLLDITRLQDKQVELKSENIDLRSTVSGVIDMTRFMTDDQYLQFKLDIPYNFPDIYADKERLIQILYNLLDNAVKYTKHGNITVSVRRKNGMAEITVSDTGSGISEEIQDIIFQSYRQEESRISSISGGIGLGLAICKHLVDLHGGKISLKSMLGEGTTVTFTMPITKDVGAYDLVTEEVATTYDAPQELAATTPAASVDGGHLGKILVVDDHPVNSRIIRAILTTDYEIISVLTGKEALNLIHSQAFDLVISDVMMPGMSGYELTEIIREKYSISELPIILLTAREQAEDIFTAFRVGANDYIVKPLNAIELKARVAALTELKYSIKEQLRIEAAWLQAQIKPHFLYNALNTIASLSEIDTDRMIDLLHEFGAYLHKSFDIKNVESLIPINDELELVQSYTYIEKERHGERLKINCEKEETFTFEVPPLSIQTLVENAIAHGILKKIDGGTVTVKIINHETEYEVAIIDDGVGMSEEKIKNLLEGHKNQTFGIGIRNTNQRLIKLFGRGLEIESKLDIGTKVSFKVPK